MPTEHRQPLTKSSYIERLLDVIELVMQQPRTARELIEVTGYKADTIYSYLLRCVQHGIMRVVEVRRLDSGREQAVYGMQSRPHEQPGVTSSR